jgi:hypothetical protein
MITENDIERIRAGEAACMAVSPEYFRNGDYSAWQSQVEETENMSYDEYQDWLVEYMEGFDSIEVHSDGCIYGNKGGISHDISYKDFNDIETFIELMEKYGLGEVQFYGE